MLEEIFAAPIEDCKRFMSSNESDLVKLLLESVVCTSPPSVAVSLNYRLLIVACAIQLHSSQLIHWCVGTTVFHGPRNFEPNRSFLCFHEILQNLVILGRTLQSTLSFDWLVYYTNRRIIKLHKNRLTVLIYGTICSLCKVYLVQSMDFTCVKFCLHHGLFTCGINCVVSK